MQKQSNDPTIGIFGLADAEHLSADAKLGRIFRGMLSGLAEIERKHLKTEKRTAEDVRQFALNSLGVIGKAILDSKRLKHNAIDSDNLPWPLFVLTTELHDVFKGHASPVLTPVTAEDQPKGAPAANWLRAHMKARAVDAFSRLVEAGWPSDKAAKAISEIFNAHDIKANGSEPVTPETVKEWSRKVPKKGAVLVREQLATVREMAEDLYTMGELHGYSKQYLAEFLLADFKKYIAGTVYEQ